MSRFDVTPLDGAFGAEISGIDLSKPMDDATAREFLEIYFSHQLIRVRGQDLAFEDYDDLTKTFGDQRPHFLDHLRMRGHAAILMLSNILENDKPIGVFEGAAFWHTDVAYEDPPNSSTVVYGIEHPDGGCPTYFADMYTAYDDLPQSMKDRIDDLQVVHHYGNRWDMDEKSRTSAETLTPEQKANVQNVIHPLVRTHHITGRKALYGVCGSAFHIVGMPDEEAVPLLDELAHHAIQEKYVTVMEVEVGDVGAWDTYATLHKATLQDAATGTNDRRLLWRVSVTGKPPVFR
jgi:taurine dioxygenase